MHLVEEWDGPPLCGGEYNDILWTYDVDKVDCIDCLRKAVSRFISGSVPVHGHSNLCLKICEIFGIGKNVKRLEIIIDAADYVRVNVISHKDRFKIQPDEKGFNEFVLLCQRYKLVPLEGNEHEPINHEG